MAYRTMNKIRKDVSTNDVNERERESEREREREREYVRIFIIKIMESQMQYAL